MLNFVETRRDYVVFSHVDEMVSPPSSALGVAFFFLRCASNSIASKAKRRNSSADSAIVLSGVLVWGS